jgi:enamidase
MVVMMHSGGTSIPGTSIITADHIIATDPHIVSYLNRGPTALFLEEASTLIEKTPYIIEITHCGNMKRAAKVMEVAKKTNIINRVIIGNDAPKAAEIVVALAVTDSGRPHPRIGGLGKDEAKKEDGLR